MNANYSIVEINNDLNFVLIRDQNGPMSITNDAENVVDHLITRLRSKLNLTLDDFPPHKIFYIDSTGSIDMLKTNDIGQFIGFEFYSLNSLEQLKNVLERVNG